MEWQPIETAPKDGTEFLVWDGYGYDVCAVGWHDNDGNPVWFNGDVSVEPTHWTPLPAPPKGGAA